MTSASHQVKSTDIWDRGFGSLTGGVQVKVNVDQVNGPLGSGPNWAGWARYGLGLGPPRGGSVEHHVLGWISGWARIHGSWSMVDTSAGLGGTASFSYEPRPSSSSYLCGLRGIGAHVSELSGEK
jgi:hypothetical protein